MKKFTAWAVALILLLTALPVGAAEMKYTPTSGYRSSEYYSNIKGLTLSGNQRLDLVNAALTQVGYHEGNSTGDLNGANVDGSRNYTEYGYWYGLILGRDPFYTPWCAMFVAWTARQAGISTDIISNSAYARIGRNPYHFHNTFREAGSYTPLSGDLIFFDWSGTREEWSHVGIVAYTANGWVYTVEGNSDGAVAIRRYVLNDAVIKGYGVPDYESGDASAVYPENYSVPTSDLRYGDKGEGVKWMQASLLRLGYPVTVDGVLSSMTLRQLKRFQSDNGLDVDGVCGPITRSRLADKVKALNAMDKPASAYPVPERTLRAGDSGDEVCWLQAAFAQLGYEQSVTGFYGGGTELRVKQYQQEKGLPETGNCGPLTRESLLKDLKDMVTVNGKVEVTPAVTVSTEQSESAASADEPAKGELSVGMTGSDVLWLQKALDTMGWSMSGTSYFGPQTKAGVEWFQRNFGLPVTGIVDKRTRAYIVNYLKHLESKTAKLESSAAKDNGKGSGNGSNAETHNGYPVPTREIRQGDSGDDVKWLQAALCSIGLTINVTGYFGPKTEAKIKYFQKEFGLSPTGVVDRTTRAYIRNILNRMGVE